MSAVGGNDAFEEIRAQGVAGVARAFGLNCNGARIWPCPACKTEHRGSSDGRPPVDVGNEGQGWECHRCKEKGDAVTLACWCAVGSRLGGGDPRWKEVLSRAREMRLAGPGHHPAPPAAPAPASAPRDPPPRAEVEALWAACRPVTELDTVMEWLNKRGLSVPELVTRDLVRALPGQIAQPRWAEFGERDWLNSKQQFRVIVPLFDVAGNLASLHARALKPQLKNDKAASPKGYRLSRMVMANGLARKLLAGDAAAAELARSVGVLIVEGVPDFLTAATQWPTGETPAVFGVINGSWPKGATELAARIPAGARLVLATHHDEAGEKYSTNVATSLAARHSAGEVELVRLRKVNDKGDLNDFLKAGGKIDLADGDPVPRPSSAQAETEAERGDGPKLDDLDSSSTLEEVQATLDSWAFDAMDLDRLERETARERAVAAVKATGVVSAASKLVDAALAKHTKVERERAREKPQLRVIQGGDATEADPNDDPAHPKQRKLFSRSQLSILQIVAVEDLRNRVECLKGVDIAFDVMAVQPSVGGRVLDDNLVTQIQADVELAFTDDPEKGTGLRFTWEMVERALHLVASKKRFHPLQDYLRSLTWDGKPRIVHVLEDVLNVQDPSAMQQLMLRKWFLSLAARALEPGCYVKSMLILVGPQNASKSTFFRMLMPNPKYFNDKAVDISNKESEMLLARVWLQEWAELKQLQGKTADQVKAFISSQSTQVILKFENHPTDLPRTAVIVGSTNDEQFLDDPTGHVRYWPIRVGNELYLDAVADMRDQLWAEAKAALDAGEKWWPTPEESEQIAHEVHPFFVKEDPWEKRVLHEAAFFGESGFHIDQIFERLFTSDIQRWDRGSVGRVMSVLRSHGYCNNNRIYVDNVRLRIWKKKVPIQGTFLDH